LKQALQSVSEICSSLNERRRQLEDTRVLIRLRNLNPVLIQQLSDANRPLQRSETARAVILSQQRSGVKRLCDGNVTVCLFLDAMLLVDERSDTEPTFFVIHFSFAKIIDYTKSIHIECIFRGETLDIELFMDNDRDQWREYVLSNVEKCKKMACKKALMNERELDDLIRKELVLARGYPRMIYEVTQIQEKKDEMAKFAEQARERLKKGEEKMQELQREIERLRMEREDYVMELHHLTSVREHYAKDLQSKKEEKRVYEEKIMSILDSKYLFEILFASLPDGDDIVAETPLSV
jgi:FtsZ-binding cell division protein ZapB